MKGSRIIIRLNNKVILLLIECWQYLPSCGETGLMRKV